MVMMAQRETRADWGIFVLPAAGEGVTVHTGGSEQVAGEGIRDKGRYELDRFHFSVVLFECDSIV